MNHLRSRILAAFDRTFGWLVAGLDMDAIRKLRKENPRTAFIFIYHTTKEGNFRGKNENAHEVDVIVEVADGKASGNGRFGIGGEVGVF